MTGVAKLIKYRHSLDFKLLMSGRVTLEESLERSDTVSTVCSISIPERIRLPPLLEHEAVYRGALECVAKANHIDEFFDHKL